MTQAFKEYLPSFGSATSLSLNLVQSIYVANHLYVLSYVWPNGEQLDIALTSSAKIHNTNSVPDVAQLHLHWMQYYWLCHYPFLQKLGTLDNYCAPDSEFYLSLSGFKFFDLSQVWENCLWIGGRDHWGHTILDFLPSYYYAKSLLSSYSCTPLRPFERRFQSNIDFLYRHFSLKPPLSLPGSSFPTLYYLGQSMLIDSLSPALFFDTFSGIQKSYRCLNVCERSSKLALLPSRNTFFARVINGSEILDFLRGLGFSFLLPEDISLSENPCGPYANCSIVFSMFGSIIYNPLIYSTAPIVCLFPSGLFCAEPKFSEQFIPLLPLVNRRLFLIDSSCKYITRDTANPIDKPCHYDLGLIMDQVNRLLVV